MHLNSSTFYAMQIMLYLSRNKGMVSSSELSSNLRISQRYILKITKTLRKNGMIVAHMGARGGYSLIKDAPDISVYDIIIVMEGFMSIPVSMEPLPGFEAPRVQSSLHDTIGHMKEYIESFLRAVTINKLATLENDGGLQDTFDMVRSHIDAIKQQN